MELVLEGEERERDSCEDKWFRQLGWIQISRDMGLRIDLGWNTVWSRTESELGWNRVWIGTELS